MKITFEINTKFLNDSETSKIIEYVTSNLLSARSYYENDVLSNMEGSSSCPFAKIDMQFTIADSNFDDRYALSDSLPNPDELSDEAYDKIMRGMQL
jgi:hypothetical protein